MTHRPNCRLILAVLTLAACGESTSSVPSSGSSPKASMRCTSVAGEPTLSASAHAEAVAVAEKLARCRPSRVGQLVFDVNPEGYVTMADFAYGDARETACLKEVAPGLVAKALSKSRVTCYL